MTDPDIVDAYEHLRSSALGQTAVAVLGWTLFLRRGLLAWAEACQTLPPLPTHAQPAVPKLPVTADADVVRVLAAMVLAVEEVRDEY